jgi:hypothetical protein
VTNERSRVPLAALDRPDLLPSAALTLDNTRCQYEHHGACLGYQDHIESGIPELVMPPIQVAATTARI